MSIPTLKTLLGTGGESAPFPLLVSIAAAVLLA
jgi:hypothetical protein